MYRKRLTILTIIILVGALVYAAIIFKNWHAAFSSRSPLAPSAEPAAFHATFKGFDISLYAANEEAGFMTDTYCSGEKGATVFDGSYELIAKKGTETISTLPIGEKQFVAGTLHDGLHVVNYTPNGDQFIVVGEYGSCNGDYGNFYTMDAKNQLVPVSFIKEGTPTFEVPIDFLADSSSTDGTFSAYDNSVGYYIYETYRYETSTYSFALTGVSATQTPSLPDGTEHWKVFRDERHGFTMEYPPEGLIKETSEYKGATFSFCIGSQCQEILQVWSDVTTAPAGYYAISLPAEIVPAFYYYEANTNDPKATAVLSTLTFFQ